MADIPLRARLSLETAPPRPRRRALDIVTVGPAQFVFFSPSGTPALRRPSTMRAYCSLKVGSSVQWMPAQVCTVKPG